MLVSLFFVPSWAASLVDENARLCVGFSTSMFPAVQENDAHAAIKVWGLAVAKERNIQVEPETRVFKSLAECSKDLSQRRVDAVGMNVIEYEQLEGKSQLGPLFGLSLAGHLTERYVVLVQGDSEIRSLTDLRGRPIAIHSGSPRQSLAEIWFDLELMANGMSRDEPWVVSAKREIKVARAVLPVFFRQLEGCVVSQRGFATICELNPQVASRLRILATSADYVPNLFALRSTYNPPFREAILQSVRELHSSPSGQQLLLMFQGERLVEMPEERLASAFELIRRHRETFPERARSQP